MSASDIDSGRKNASVTAFVYLLISLFCILFGAVYELFSHEVYSYYMLYAFCFPLVGGTTVFHILYFLKVTKYPNTASQNLYHSGIATLTAGSILRGVLDIYGTTNVLSECYWPVGIVLCVLGIVVYIATLLTKNT